jgi:hypothetical protein
LEDLGNIGLPLSDREAGAILQKSGLRVCRELHNDSLSLENGEFAASKLSVRNSEWEKFMDTVTHKVYKALGIHISTSKPRFELIKLVIGTKGWR